MSDQFDKTRHNSPIIYLRMVIYHYAIPGLQYGANLEEIKKAHRKLALRCILR